MKKILILLLFCSCVVSWGKTYFSDQYLYLGSFTVPSYPAGTWYYRYVTEQYYLSYSGNHELIRVSFPDGVIPLASTWGYVNDEGKEFLRNLLPNLDTDSDGFSDFDELDYGSDPNDADSLPAITKIYDQSGVKIGQRFDNGLLITWDSGVIHNAVFFIKDENGNLQPAGVSENGSSVNFCSDDVSNVKHTYNEAGDIVGAEYTIGGMEYMSFPGYWGSTYNSEGQYTGSISNSGSFGSSAGSSSGGHNSLNSGSGLGGDSVSSPTIPSTGNIFTPPAGTSSEFPTIPDDTTTVDAIKSQSGIIIDMGDLLDSRMRNNDENRNQQANIMNDNLAGLRLEQVTLTQAKLNSDLALHNDRTNQLNQIDNSIAGLRDDLAQSQQIIIDNSGNDNQDLINELNKNTLSSDISIPELTAWNTIVSKLSPDVSGSFGSSASLIEIPVNYGICSWTISADINNAPACVSPLITTFRFICHSLSYIVFSWVFVRSIYGFLNK